MVDLSAKLAHVHTRRFWQLLSFGIGASRSLAHEYATQTLWQRPPQDDAHPDRRGRSRDSGVSAQGRHPGDLSSRIGIKGGAAQHVSREYAGSTITARCRWTQRDDRVCNMSIEAGASPGMIAPDATTYAYMEGRPLRRSGAEIGTSTLAHWQTLFSRTPRRRSSFPSCHRHRCERHRTKWVTWGTNPGHALPGSPARSPTRNQRPMPNGVPTSRRSLLHGHRHPGTRLTDIASRPRVHRLVHQCRGSRTCAAPPPTLRDSRRDRRCRPRGRAPARRQIQAPGGGGGP